jgi:hypothetical protein
MKLEELLEERELAKSLKVSRQTMLEYRHQGLPWIKLGQRVFYEEAEFTAWISKNRKRVADPSQRVVKQRKEKMPDNTT